MGRIFRKNLDRYSLDFWSFIIIVIVFMAIIIGINLLSDIPSRHMMEETTKEWSLLSDEFSDIQDAFEFNDGVMNQLVDKKYSDVDNNGMQDLDFDLNTILNQFVTSRAYLSGYFYSLQTENSLAHSLYVSPNTKMPIPKEISGLIDKSKTISYWKYQTDNEVLNMYYISNLYKNRQFIGFVGIKIDTPSIAKNIKSTQTSYLANTIVADENLEILFNSSPIKATNLHYVTDKGFQTLIKKINSKEKSGFCMVKVDDKYKLLTYTKLSTGQIILEIHNKAGKYNMTHFLVILIGIISIICVLFVQRNLKTKNTLLDDFTNLLMKNYISTIDPSEVNNRKAAFSLQTGIFFAILFFTIFEIFYGTSILKISIDFGLICICLVATYLFSKNSFNAIYANIFVGAMLFLPFVFHLMNGGFSGESSSGAVIIWASLAVILAQFLFGSEVGRRIFKLYVLLLFCDVLIELNIIYSMEYIKIFKFITSILCLSFSLFISIELFMTRSAANYSKLEETISQLKEAQSQLVQKEKMVTLGRLIAGVAHEINTPIGAIKASAETLNASYHTIFRTVMDQTKNFTEDDYKAFFKLSELSADSVREMRSTSQIRRAKAQMIQYFNDVSLCPENSRTDIITMLVRLEICDLEKIQFNIEIFKKPNIAEVLKVVCAVSPNIMSTQTIAIASEKVSKIVFALKSYAHTNISNEFETFDLVRNIENVLVLYQNQIKVGIEVVKLFDEKVPPLFGNSDELSQVWTNIIQNAIYAMSGVGTLTIKISYVHNQQVEISFIDTGTGMEPEVLKNIFNPFYTTKPIGEGSGLGLDICNKIVKNHKGDILVESIIGVGSTFKVTLPYVQESY